MEKISDRLSRLDKGLSLADLGTALLSATAAFSAPLCLLLFLLRDDMFRVRDLSLVLHLCFFFENIQHRQCAALHGHHWIERIMEASSLFHPLVA